MTDPLSMASAVAGLVSLADIVLTKTYRYVRAIQTADRSVKEFEKQVQTLYGTMTVLKAKLKSLSDDPTSQFDAQSSAPAIVDDCTHLLVNVQNRLDKYQPKQQQGKSQAIKSMVTKLRWPFEAEQTKELVEQLQRFNAILDTALHGETLTAIHATLKETVKVQDGIKKLDRVLRMNTHRLEAFILNNEQQETIKYFNQCDPSQRHQIARKLCQPGTGKWFTEGADFSDWLKDKNGRLWLSGIPGAGKTVLASSIVETIRLQTSRSSETTAFVYFYCDYKDPQTHDPLMILNTVAANLARWHADAVRLLQDYYEKFHRPGRKASLEDDPGIEKILERMSKVYDRVYLVVDGLDECGKAMKEVSQMLSRLILSDTSNIQSILLSRNEVDISNVLAKHHPEIQIAAQSHDLRLFVHSQLDRFDLDDADDREKISEVLVSKADGMFRWVACQIDYLEELPTLDARMKALQDLPPDLNSSYDRILHRLITRPPEIQRLVGYTLKWLILAKEQLTIAALKQALSIGLGQHRYDKSRLPSEKVILRSCSSFVRKSADGNHLEPAHFTVEEYLRQIAPRNFRSASFRIDDRLDTLLLAQTCLTFLNMDNFQDIIGLPDCDGRHQEHPFRRHAVRWWADYTRDHLDDTCCRDLCEQLLGPHRSVCRLAWLHDLVWQVKAKRSQEGMYLSDLKDFQSIHCAIFLHLPDMFEHLKIQSNYNFEENTTHPLMLYAILGDLVPLLVVGGLHELKSRPPSSYTVDGATYRTLKELLRLGLMPTENIYYPPPRKTYNTLHLLCCFHNQVEEDEDSRTKCVKLLLDGGLRIGRSTFDHFIEHNMFACISGQMVPEHHVQGDVRVDWFKAIDNNLGNISNVISMDPTQLELLNAKFRSAVRYNNTRIMAEILDLGLIDVDAVGEGGETALCMAATFKCLDAAKLLVEHGANIYFEDEHGKTVYHDAIIRRDDDFIRYLLNIASAQAVIPAHGHTLWKLAAKVGCIVALEWLHAAYIDDKLPTNLVQQYLRDALRAAVRACCDHAVVWVVGRLPEDKAWSAIPDLAAECVLNLASETLEYLASRGMDFSQVDQCSQVLSKYLSTYSPRLLE